MDASSGDQVPLRQSTGHGWTAFCFCDDCEGACCKTPTLGLQHLLDVRKCSFEVLLKELLFSEGYSNCNYCACFRCCYQAAPSLEGGLFQLLLLASAGAPARTRHPKRNRLQPRHDRLSPGLGGAMATVSLASRLVGQSELTSQRYS